MGSVPAWQPLPSLPSYELPSSPRLCPLSGLLHFVINTSPGLFSSLLYRLYVRCWTGPPRTDRGSVDPARGTSVGADTLTFRVRMGHEDVQRERPQRAWGPMCTHCADGRTKAQRGRASCPRCPVIENVLAWGPRSPFQGKA